MVNLEVTNSFNMADHVQPLRMSYTGDDDNGLIPVLKFNLTSLNHTVVICFTSFFNNDSENIYTNHSGPATAQSLHVQVLVQAGAPPNGSSFDFEARIGITRGNMSGLCNEEVTMHGSELREPGPQYIRVNYITGGKQALIYS